MIAAAAGGLVGVTLWFNRPEGQGSRPTAVLVALSCLVVLCLSFGLGLIEATSVANGLHVGLHLLAAAFALVALRILPQLRCRIASGVADVAHNTALARSDRSYPAGIRAAPRTV